MIAMNSQQLDDPMSLARDDRAESGIIGSILLLETCLDDFSATLKPEHFARDDCSTIYGHMLDLRSKGKHIDITLLADRLRKAGQLERVGGLAALGELAREVDTPQFAKHYAEIVRRNSLRRILYCKAHEIAGFASDDSYDTTELIEQLDKTIYNLRDEHRAGNESIWNFADVMHESMDVIERRSNGEIPGIETGYRDLNEMLRFREGELIILAARPSMGKSALATNFATKVAKQQGGGVLFVSLEMSARELGLRMLAAETSVDIGGISKGTIGKADRRKLNDSAADLATTNLITIDDTPGRTVWDIAATARRMARKEKLNLIIIDYLQLLVPTDRKVPRQEQVASQSRSLKLLARELNVPIICLAQMNRQSEQGTDHTPKLSHLRESGAIEQDADVVLFVHRPGYYDPKLPQDEAELRLAKQRNGQTGVVKVVWQKQFTRFDDMATAMIQANYNPELDNGNW